MPYFREKLLVGSKIIQIQKRWLFWAAGYMRLDTPINKMKEKCVELEKKATRLRNEIQMCQSEYDTKVASLKVSPLRDTDGGGITQWKHERNPFWKFSIFQWSIPFTQEPTAFDPKLYRRGGGTGWGSPPVPKRSKDVEMAINSLKEDATSFRTKMQNSIDGDAYAESGDEKGGSITTPLAVFTPGLGLRHINKRKNEDDVQFKKRQEENAGKVEGIEE